jgi:phospholipid/cholesterol/gamma-HCH transport system substrate-binding protein
MKNALKVGIFAAIALAVLAFLILRIEDLKLFGAEGQRIDAVFDSVAGLDDKAAVRVAGVRVGRVDGIGLDGARARVSLLLEQPVPLTVGAHAVIASAGLLGDKYIELVPGPPGGAPLPEGTVLEGETPVSFDQAMEQISEIGQSIQNVTGSLSGALSGDDKDSRIAQLLENLERISADVRDLLAANRSEVDATIRNFESASATLARELPRLAERMEMVLAEVGAVVGDNRDELSESLTNIRQLTESLKPTVADLNTISGRLAAGEGTVGKLLTSDEAHDQLVKTLGTIETGVGELSETLGAVQKIGLDLNLGGYYLADAEQGQASLTIDIDTRSDWLYRAGLVDSAYGRERTTSERITTTGEDGNVGVRTIETVKFDDKLLVNALLGHQLGDDFRLYTGLIESSFGVQAQYPLLDDRLWLTFEAFDFDRPDDRSPHLRFGTEWRLNPNLYLLGGYDDLLESDRNSFFLGGGIRWNDPDLKYLVGAAPKL